MLSSSAASSRPTSVTTPPSTQTGSPQHTAAMHLCSIASTQWPVSCPQTTTSTSTRPSCSQDQVRSDDIHPQSSLLIHQASSACDDIEWINNLAAYISRVAQDKPSIKIIGRHALRLSTWPHHELIGICFGHQIVARALGAQVTRNNKWEVGPTPVALTDLGKALFGVDTIVWLLMLPMPECSHTRTFIAHPRNAPGPCALRPAQLPPARINTSVYKSGHGPLLRRRDAPIR